MNSVYISSYGAKQIGKYPTIDENEMAMDVIADAVHKIDLETSLIDGIITTPNTENQQNMHPSRICELLRISPEVAAVLACGGMSGGAAIRSAYNEIALGHIECLVLYVASKEYTGPRTRPRGPPLKSWGNTDYHPIFQPFTQHILGIWDHYGSTATRYMHDFGATEADFALAAVRDSNNAAHNPYSCFKDKRITLEEVLTSPMWASPIKRLDTCMSRDGAAALIFMNEKLAKEHSQTPIKVAGIGESHDSCNFLNKNPHQAIHEFPALKNAADKALQRAGDLKLSDIDVAELYAPFSPFELMIPECIGWFEKGEMIERIKDGSTEVGGTIPINTLGGVLGRGHPALTTPIYEMIDVIRQLQNEAGPNQVKDAETGFMQCEGGLTNNIFVTILKKEVGKR